MICHCETDPDYVGPWFYEEATAGFSAMAEAFLEASEDA